jgi:predicted acetyltransferase
VGAETTTETVEPDPWETRRCRARSCVASVSFSLVPELISPTTRLHASWLEAMAEFGRDARPPGSGIPRRAGLTNVDAFARWVAHLKAMADSATQLPDGHVHASYWWITDSDQYIGAITLRHRLTPALIEVGGHIGFSVRPSARRMGYASWALGAVLERARTRGMPKVLVTCDEDNVASARVIEVNGGVLEDIRQTASSPARRYWIHLTPPARPAA